MLQQKKKKFCKPYANSSILYLHRSKSMEYGGARICFFIHGFFFSLFESVLRFRKGKCNIFLKLTDELNFITKGNVVDGNDDFAP